MGQVSSCETGLIPRCRSYSEMEKATSSDGEWLAWEEPRAVGDLVHVETFFVRNLGGLIHVRTRVPGRHALPVTDEASQIPCKELLHVHKVYARGSPIQASTLWGILPSLDRHLGIRPVSQLNTWPVVSPVNASRRPSRDAAHHSGSGRMASPYPMGDFHLLFFASFPGALRQWVKLRKTRCEHMFSASPTNSDIARCSWHVSNGPEGDMSLSSMYDTLSHRSCWESRRRRNDRERLARSLRAAHRQAGRCYHLKQSGSGHCQSLLEVWR